MSRYKPYSQYKDSGVAWLGEIPQEWNSIKFKHVFLEKKKKNNLLLDCGSISFGEVVYKDNDKIPEETKAAYQEVLVGEFLVNPLNLNFDLKSLRTALSNINVVVSTGYIVLQSQKNTDKNYLRWLLYHFDIAHMKTLGAGVRQTVNFTDIGNEYFYIPTIKEQQAIANFLDNATCKIDALIQKQQNLIELLKEKRQALISHAVTKGLNPHIKMKDSGVEWLGEVPEHWKILQLKRISSIKGGYAFSTADFVDDGVQIIKIGNVYQSKFHIDRQPTYVSQEIAKETKEFLITEGDLIISLTGTLGKRDYGFAVTVDQKGEYLLNQRVAKMLPNKKLVELIYFSYVMKSEQYLTQIYALPSGTKQANLSNENVLSAICSLPDLLEQRAISNYLDNATCKIDTLIAKVQKAIELLKERRTALISAVVTGKIDVRECVGDNSNCSEIPNSSNQR